MGLSMWLDLYAVFLLFLLFVYLFVSVTVKNVHKAYFAFHFFMMLWPLCQFAIKMTENPQIQLIYVKLAFVDLSLLGIGWLVFTFFLTGRTALLRDKKTILFFIPALLTAAGVLINYNGTFVQPFDGGYIQRHYGTLFWLVIPVLLCYLFVPLIILSKTLVSAQAPRMKRQVKLVLIGIVIVTVLAILDIIINVVYFPAFPVIPGLTSFGIFSSAVFFVISIHRYKMLDIVTIAHQDVIDTIADGILVLDEYESILEINRSLRPYLNLQLGDRFEVETLLKHSCVASQRNDFLLTYLEEPMRTARIEMITADDKRHISLQAAPIIINEVRVGRIVTLQDVTEIRRLVNDLERLAITDSLTGCYNRHYLTRHLESDIMLHVNGHRPFAVLLLDIDYFKRINDQYGHLVGDEVICWTVDTIRGAIRQSDIIARFGGEEFMIYLPDTDPKKAAILADRIKDSIETNQAAVENGAYRLSISVSMGLLSVDTFDEGLQSNPKGYITWLFALVDEALYQAKKNGRNRIVSSAVQRKAIS
ncbi:diguanylate cyclase [Paenibacillus sp. MBLB4367]|uniref:histidine kinase N-terminal 7TM domain-containing diguanylate cyclase n=1 Tax=Paenibacillus sp. MBLB4367 TaxID=3384767 RepID=UPI0039081604